MNEEIIQGQDNMNSVSLQIARTMAGVKKISSVSLATFRITTLLYARNLKQHLIVQQRLLHWNVLLLGY